MQSALPRPAQISAAGEKIYNEKFRAKFEREFSDQFAAIEIEGGDAFVGRTADEALEKARKAFQSGLFFLVRIGAAGAFKISRTSNGGHHGVL